MLDEALNEELLEHIAQPHAAKAKRASETEEVIACNGGKLIGILC
jgi:hypothetical protein